MLAVEMTAHEDVQSGTGAAADLLGQLHDDAIPGHGVIARDHALVLMTEDLLEVNGAEGHEGRGGIGGGPVELGVEVGQEALTQIPIGGGHRRDAGPAQLVDEPALQGAVHAFTAAAGLGGVAEDMLDAELGQRPPHLGRFRAVDAAAGDGGVGGPVRAIGVEGHRQPPGGEHRAQRRHNAGGALALLVLELGIGASLVTSSTTAMSVSHCSGTSASH